ncbi:MAG: DUF3604 domain-containing protein [SAR86 cluster bacterium]|nr:DUF3604 domain-containing protein [SAR86 cluster bacterium]
MSIVIRTFLIALLFAGIIFILGANNVFSIKDDVADFSLDPIDSSVAVNINPNRDAFFGDLHVHTMYSFDAFIFGTTASPDDAYKYAKGGSIKHPLGFDMQLDDPLDFYAITDHAAWLGMIRAYADPDSKPGQLDFAADLHGLNDPENLNTNTFARRAGLFANLLTGELVKPSNNPIKLLGAYLQEDTIYGTGAYDRETHQSAWRDVAEAAERHNNPGEFTTFIAYEFTSSGPGQSNLHRNVIFKNSKAPIQPFSIVDSRNPEELWDWMDNLRTLGIESLAIPHNSNGSNGQMFKLVDWAGNPMDDDYASKRMRNEPLVEITQVKGTSDTHPLLSPEDKWADFGIMNNRVASPFYSSPTGSYVRNAYLRGLSLDSEFKINPYKFGLVGASDTHTGAVSDKESDYHSKIGILDGTPELRGAAPLTKAFKEQIEESGSNVIIRGYTEIGDQEYIDTGYTEWGASGLAAVWSENNTRESIYDAFRRKETFATTGSRIKVRFFGGYKINDIFDKDDPVNFAYSNAVTMGSDMLQSKNQIPQFMVWALRDAKRAPLDRVQIIKGWTELSGKPHEEIYDVACSDGRTPNPDTNLCNNSGASVNLSNCQISGNSGADELKAVWEDPDFDPNLKAFYYVRVLENPTCRWSTWDALKSGEKPREDLPATIQERAWSSPIWYVPDNDGITISNILPDDV